MRSRDILSQGKVLFASSIYSFLANVAFNAVMSRKLGLEGYGVLGSLLSVYMVLFIPLQTFQTVLSKAAAQALGGNRAGLLASLHGHAWAGILAAGLVLLSLGHMARWPLARFLHLDNPALVMIVVLMVIGSFASTLVKALLQGFQKFNEMGMQIFMDTTVRLVAAVLLVLGGFGVAGALASSVLSAWAGVLLGLGCLAMVMKPLWALRPRPVFKEHWGFALPAGAALFLYGWMTLTDVAFARHWFSGEPAGIYSAVSTVGRVFLWGPLMLTAYMFPKAAYMHSRQEDVRHLLKKTLTLSWYVIGGSLALCLFGAKPVVGAMFGAQYAPAADLLPAYGLALTPMAFNWILMNYFLAVGKYGFLWGMAASVVVYNLGMDFYHGSLWHLAAVVGVSGTVFLASNIILLKRADR